MGQVNGALRRKRISCSAAPVRFNGASDIRISEVFLRSAYVEHSDLIVVHLNHPTIVATAVPRACRMTIDSAWLGSWIQPQHLLPQAIDAYRGAFAAHPARLHKLHNFLVPAVAAGVSRFLSNDAKFRPIHGLYSGEDHPTVPEEQWLAADETDRMFRYRVLEGARDEHEWSPDLLAYLRFRMALHDARFIRFFAAVTGSPVCRAHCNFNMMKAGDFLRRHTDDVDDRRLTFALYLSPGWSAGFGGDLCVLDSRGGEMVLAAEYNSVVVFDVVAHTEHWVTDIEPTAGETARISAAGWLYEQVSSEHGPAA